MDRRRHRRVARTRLDRYKDRDEDTNRPWSDGAREPAPHQWRAPRRDDPSRYAQRVAAAVQGTGEIEALRAARPLLVRQVDRIDALLLSLTRDRLEDERRRREEP